MFSIGDALRPNEIQHGVTSGFTFETDQSASFLPNVWVANPRIRQELLSGWVVYLIVLHMNRRVKLIIELDTEIYFQAIVTLAYKFIMLIYVFIHRHF